jgi:RNA polymerase sigma-70 factor (ECF subfamily)
VRGYDNPTGWVYRVALNFARTRLRRGAREVPFPLEFGEWEMRVPNPELVPALLRLPLAFREVVVLKYLNDWSEREIAEALGLPAGTVKSRLHRALARLREDLS